jgi:hypothetical protein
MMMPSEFDWLHPNDTYALLLTEQTNLTCRTPAQPIKLEHLTDGAAGQDLREDREKEFLI